MTSSMELGWRGKTGLEIAETRTESVTALLEVLEKRVAHLGGGPLVLLIDERHGGWFARVQCPGVVGYPSRRRGL
jgi:hypothetical protein